GTPKRSLFGQLQMNKNNINADGSTFVNDYLPTSKGDGTQRMEQFTKMIGDTDTAKNVLKMNYFDSGLKTGDANASKVLGKYNNLSDEQKGYLFNPDEMQTF